MAELKTKPINQSVKSFIAKIADEQTREDCTALVKLMKSVTGKPPQMWGTSIIGFGTYRYKYASGREGNWMTTGFSPRNQNLTIYIMTGFADQQILLKKLGKCKTASSCLYIKRLADIDTKVLEQMVAKSIKRLPGQK